MQLPASLPSLQGLQHFACTSGWERLRSLAHLQELSLHSCALDAVAHGAPPLLHRPGPQLQPDCTLAPPWAGDLAPLAPQLQALQLYSCELNAVPSALSRLSRLTRLDLSWNPLKKGGWERLAPLTALVELKRPSS